MTLSPILDLAGITLEVNHLARGVRFYAQTLGLTPLRVDHEGGVAELRVNEHQTLRLWQPVTRQPGEPRLASLRARGASHLHFAFQVLAEDLETCRERLAALGLPFIELDLSAQGEAADPGLYFFDPFGHGLELRGIDRHDSRQPHFLPAAPETHPFALPVVGLREAALAFGDYRAMLERLPRAYGFAFAKEQEERDFAQFTLAPRPEADGQGTPQRWLYAWDPQVGLADMLGGDHAHLTFYADVERVTQLVVREGLPYVRGDWGLAVRDPEGHVFEFVPV